MREEHQKAMAEERKGGLECLGNYRSSCVLVGDFFLGGRKDPLSCVKQGCDMMRFVF